MICLVPAVLACANHRDSGVDGFRNGQHEPAEVPDGTTASSSPGYRPKRTMVGCQCNNLRIDENRRTLLHLLSHAR